MSKLDHTIRYGKHQLKRQSAILPRSLDWVVIIDWPLLDMVAEQADLFSREVRGLFSNVRLLFMAVFMLNLFWAVAETTAEQALRSERLALFILLAGCAHAVFKAVFSSGGLGVQGGVR